MNRISTNEAVSEIVGVMLLLGMTVALFSVLSIIVLSQPSTPSSPSTYLMATIDDNCLLLEHRGGEPLPLETQITLTSDMGMSKTIIVGESNYLDEEAKLDNQWGIGEWLVYQDNELVDREITITVIDVRSNSIVLTGLLRGS